MDTQSIDEEGENRPLQNTQTTNVFQPSDCSFENQNQRTQEFDNPYSSMKRRSKLNRDKRLTASFGEKSKSIIAKQ